MLFEPPFSENDLREGLIWFDFLEALRREAGVMFGDALSSESDAAVPASLIGVRGR
jgi:hypothetical protein